MLFLRSLLRDLDPGLDPGLVLQKDLLRSLDELERARLEPHVSPTASARLFFALAGHQAFLCSSNNLSHQTSLPHYITLPNHTTLPHTPPSF